MSKNNLSFKKIKKYLNWKNFIVFLIQILIVVMFVLIFIFGINKKWYDGLSVIALIYICFGFLIIVFSIAEFKTINKIKNLFSVKKENNEKLNKFEKMQMKVLGIENLKKEEQEKQNKEKAKMIFHFMSISFLILGIILLIISLPFMFN